MNSSFVEVHASIEMQSRWDELGLDADACEHEITELRKSCHELYKDAVDNLAKRCMDTKERIGHINAVHRQAMTIYGLSESEIGVAIEPVASVNLLSQLEKATEAYEGFKKTCAKRIGQLEKLVEKIAQLFNVLRVSVDDRGEFTEVGEVDFSMARVKRFEKLISELESDVTSRLKIATSAKAAIREICGELNCSPDAADQLVITSDALDDTSASTRASVLASLEAKKADRMDEMSRLATEITYLWDLLDIGGDERADFLKRHMTIGEDVIVSCREQLHSLRSKRDEQLPDIILRQRLEIASLCSEMHIAESISPEFADAEERSAVCQEFEFLKAEIMRLQALAADRAPILTAVEERECLVREYDEVLRASADTSRLLSRERGLAQKLMHEEKVRRRYKVVLPKLEKKIRDLLTSYRATHGSDFEWDGEPYITKLDARKPAKPVVTETRAGTLPFSPRPKRIRMNENANANGVCTFRGLPAFMS